MSCLPEATFFVTQAAAAAETGKAMQRSPASRAPNVARSTVTTTGAVSVGETPWRERPLLKLKTAAEIAGVSPASLYRIEAEGRLVFKRLAGRTLVETESFIAFLSSAEKWTPSAQVAPAVAARKRAAAAAWAE